MLKRLHVKNLALISELELEFGDNLNVLSGETGAGKSIVVDSLMLLLGAKYDKTYLRYGCDYGFVEGVFEVSDKQKEKLSDFGIDEDDVLIIGRKFGSDGKNDIRVNGKSFTASMLKNLMSSFVDIYGQNEYQSLSRPSEHLRIIDYFVRTKSGQLFSALESEYFTYKRICKEMNELGNISEREKNIDIYKYQIDEIEQAKILPDEETEIVAKRKLFASGERIATALSESINALNDNENGETASSAVSNALNALSEISDAKPVFSELYERLNSVSIEIDDIVETIGEEIDGLNFDEREIDRVERRYDTILSLKRKYGSFEKMTSYLEFAKQSLDKLENCSQLYEKLEKDRELSVNKIYELSVKLSEERKSVAKNLSKDIMNELSELGMEHSRFEVVFNELPTLSECENFLSAKGLDKPEFYLSPNVGQPLKPLVKIISGGEMSRFMLALKVITSKTDEIETLIFDEIDTGISGKIGQAVAQKLAKIAHGRQVLCVTHLAQIAAMADCHFYIAKQVKDDATYTEVLRLDEEGMVEEISRLSGGKDISSQAMENAAQMKKWSNDFKAAL